VLVWFLIAVSVAAVLGPLLSALPSKQQRAVAKFRDRARQAGIQVRMRGPQDLPPRLQRVSDVDLVSYGRRLPQDPPVPGLKSELWVLTREGWEARSGDVSPAIVAGIPAHIEVIQLDGEYLQVFWDERGGDSAYEQVERLLDPMGLAMFAAA